MRQINPPLLPAWLLEHVTPGGVNDALAGDLLEEFRLGRSRLWFWRQVFAALAIGLLKNLRGHSPLMAYAVLWSMLAPEWSTLIDKIENDANLYGPIYRIDWPWSTICDIGIWMMLNFAFLWVGNLLYLIPQMWIARSFSVRRIRRSFLLSMATFNAVYVCWSLLMIHFESSGRAIDRHTISPLGEIVDFRMWWMGVRIPCLLTMLCSLWRAAHRSGNRPKGLAA